MSNPLLDQENWAFVDQAYGLDADLYVDVLRIPTKSSGSEITKAYFDRRNELFTVLADLEATSTLDPEVLRAQKHLAECRMNAVVFAGRILGDVALRKQYHLEHELRIQGMPAIETKVGGRHHSIDSRPVALPALPPHPRKIEKERSRREGASSRKDRRGGRWKVSRSRSRKNNSAEEDDIDSENHHANSSSRQSRSLRAGGGRRREAPEDEDDLNDESKDRDNASRHRKASNRSSAYKPPRALTSSEKKMTKSFSNRGDRTVSIVDLADAEEGRQRRQSNNGKNRQEPSIKEDKKRVIRGALIQGNRPKKTSMRSTARAPAVVSPEKPDDTTYTMTDLDDETATYVTEVTEATEMTVDNERSLVGALLKEVSGCIDDTSNSLADVFGVFTLQEDDIQNVTKRIANAKRSLQTVHRK